MARELVNESHRRNFVCTPQKQDFVTERNHKFTSQGVFIGMEKPPYFSEHIIIPGQYHIHYLL